MIVIDGLLASNDPERDCLSAYVERMNLSHQQQIVSYLSATAPSSNNASTWRMLGLNRNYQRTA